MNIPELLAELDATLNTAIRWQTDETSLVEHKATAYTGEQVQNDGGGWRFVLVEFPHNGATQVRGAASRLGTIVNLPDELAKKALERAKVADAWTVRR